MTFLARMRRSVYLPAFALWVVGALLIWGNSLVPGSGSSALSLGVVDMLRGVLDALGLPSAWVTNLLVRKAAHLTEYALLGMVGLCAFAHGGRQLRAGMARAIAPCVCVAAIDETIQRFVPGRCGQPTDVLIDSIGVVLGVCLCYALTRAMRRRATRS